jgi:hypothetical protein
MNFAVQTSLGILWVIILINADVEQSNIKFNQQCQVKKKKMNRIKMIYFK